MVARIASRQLATTARSAARSNVALNQIRNCSMCRSVKDWKENHGTWSKTPKTTTTTSKSLATSSPRSAQLLGHVPMQMRAYATGKSLADEKIEEITEAFNTAKDEFELAWEETEKKTVYAEADREAAHDELKNMLELYEDAVTNSPAEIGKEIQERIGQRIRELQAGFQRLDELVQEGD